MSEERNAFSLPGTPLPFTEVTPFPHTHRGQDSHHSHSLLSPREKGSPPGLQLTRTTVPLLDPGETSAPLMAPPGAGPCTPWASSPHRKTCRELCPPAASFARPGLPSRCQGTEHPLARNRCTLSGCSLLRRDPWSLLVCVGIDGDRTRHGSSHDYNSRRALRPGALWGGGGKMAAGKASRRGG